MAFLMVDDNNDAPVPIFFLALRRRWLLDVDWTTGAPANGVISLVDETIVLHNNVNRRSRWQHAVRWKNKAGSVGKPA